MAPVSRDVTAADRRRRIVITTNARGLALALSLGLCLALAACGASATPPPATPPPATAAPATPGSPADPLDGTTWALSTVDDQAIPAGIAATLAFSAGSVSGTGGCNTFTGSYTIDGPSLDIGPLASTRKACADPVMTLEGQYFAALDAVTTWAVPQDAPMGTQLTLTGSGPKLVFGRPAGG